MSAEEEEKKISHGCTAENIGSLFWDYSADGKW
jgi:hypothetical protein